MPSRRELYHHGIEGQKWGVRNGPPYPLDQDDKSSSERSAESGSSGKNSYGGAHSGTSLGQISDSDLQAYVNRLNMERQYADLTREKNQTLETVRKVNMWLKELSTFAESSTKIMNFGKTVKEAFGGKKEDKSGNKNGKKGKNTDEG